MDKKWIFVSPVIEHLGFPSLLWLASSKPNAPEHIMITIGGSKGILVEAEEYLRLIKAENIASLGIISTKNLQIQTVENGEIIEAALEAVKRSLVLSIQSI